jgi:hypothetical protein
MHPPVSQRETQVTMIDDWDRYVTRFRRCSIMFISVRRWNVDSPPFRISSLNSNWQKPLS